MIPDYQTFPDGLERKLNEEKSRYLLSSISKPHAPLFIWSSGAPAGEAGSPPWRVDYDWSFPVTDAFPRPTSDAICESVSFHTIRCPSLIFLLSSGQLADVLECCKKFFGAADVMNLTFWADNRYADFQVVCVVGKRLCATWAHVINL